MSRGAVNTGFNPQQAARQYRCEFIRFVGEQPVNPNDL